MIPDLASAGALAEDSADRANEIQKESLLMGDEIMQLQGFPVWAAPEKVL